MSEVVNEIFIPSLDELPMIYENGQPKAVIVDIEVFEEILEYLETKEDNELFKDPKIIQRLREARADHVAGRVTSHDNLIQELGLEDEL